MPKGFPIEGGNVESVVVTLDEAIVTTLTPPAAITGFATSALQLANGHDVTIDNADAGAAVNIQDGGNTITVDGSVEVSSLPAIPHDALTATDVATVTGGAGQTSDIKVTLDSETVVIASLPSISGSVSIINGITVKSVAVDISATGTVIAAVVGKKIKVFAVKLILSATLSINFRNGAATLLEGPMPMTANSGYVESVTPPMFLFCTSVGASLDLVILGTGTVAGRISYWDDDAT